MNILFFLLPKSQVAFIFDDFTIRQAVEKLQHHHYTAIPVLDRKGRYLWTLSEGDILYYLKEHKDMDFRMCEGVKISEVKANWEIKAISSSARMEDLYSLATNQNFVPVVDDKGVFIGIVTRQQILKFHFTRKD